MSIGTALFACFVCAFVVYCIFAYKDDERQRAWAYKDRRKAIRNRICLLSNSTPGIWERYTQDLAEREVNCYEHSSRKA